MDYLYSIDEINKINEEVTLFVFDTNVWLDLYTLPKKCVDEILHGFTWRTEKIWLPNQVFVEFKNNYKESRGAGKHNTNLRCTLEEIFKKFEEQIESSFKVYKEKEIMGVPQINQLKNQMIQEIQRLKDNTLPTASEIFDSIKKLNSYSEKNDDIEILINALRRNSQTNGFKVLELLKIYEEGDLRFKYNTPPGFKDKEKPNNKKNENTQSKYGDLVLWKEVLQKVKEGKCNLVLVQNEKKDDWWDMSEGTRKIPKVMLEEFDEVKGSELNKFLMMDFNEFLFHFSNYFQIPATTITDILEKTKIVDEIKKKIIERRVSIVREASSLDFIEDNIISKMTIALAKKGCLDSDTDKVKAIKLHDKRAITCEFLKESFSRRLLFEGNMKTSGNVLIYKNDIDSFTVNYVELTMDFMMEVFILDIDGEYGFNTFSEHIDIMNDISINHFEFENTIKKEDIDWDWNIY